MGSQRRTVLPLKHAPDIHEFCYRLHGFPPCDPDFFLDPGGQLSSAFRRLLEQNVTRFKYGVPLRPFMITGPIKAGKSFALNKALPAFAVKSALDNGLPKPNFLIISCGAVTRSRGSSECLLSLLGSLLTAAKAAGLQHAADTLKPAFGVDAMTMLREFMYRLPQDRINYLLLDEVQKLYLLLVSTASAASQRPQLDSAAIMDMRAAMKQLFLDSPPWVAWGITGSSPATILANIAFTSTNGTALLLDMFFVELPGVVDRELIQVAWGQLQQHYRDKGVGLPAELVWCAPQNHAMLAYMCSEWTTRESNITTALTTHELVQFVKQGKLMPEYLVDLQLLLEVAPESKLLEALLAMTDSAAGVLKEALPPLLIKPLRALGAQESSDPKRLIMDNPLYCELLRMVTTEDGRLISGLEAAAVVPGSRAAPELDMYKHRQLVMLGELCFGHDKLVNELMAAMAMAMSLDAEAVIQQPWFQQVLSSKENHAVLKKGATSTAGSFKNAVSARKVTSPGVALGWFHRLQRNVLVHGDLSAQRQVLDQYPPSLSAFVEDGRVSSVLTRTFSAKRLPAAVD